MWLYMLAWPWPQSSDMDPTSPVSFGLQADSCEEDASLDADCVVVMVCPFCLNRVLHRDVPPPKVVCVSWCPFWEMF